ncbi:MAG TPA: anti-sigma factor [Albitalea sp.]|nr:anti-sigma factor [Albitalea sp.]
MNYLRPQLLDRLAREYALGTLTGPARRRFERVLRETPVALLAVGAWQERFSVLAAGVPAVEPREAVWQGLEQRLFPRAAPAPRHWLWTLLSGRTLGGALAGVLLCLTVLRLEPGWVGLEPQIESLPASYVGLLSDDAGQPTVLASSRRHGRQLTVKMLRPVEVAPGRVAQLWALPKDGAAFPVGVVPGRGSASVALADTSEKLFSNVSRLAVSIEAAPAKAGDAPSGAFVLVGPCVKLW